MPIRPIATLLFSVWLLVFPALKANSANTEEAWQQVTPCLRVLAFPGTKYRCINEHTLEITDGQMLVEASKDGAIVNPLAATYLKHHSVVLFTSNPGKERIMAIWENSANSIVAFYNYHAVSLNSGDEVLVTDHKPLYRDIHQGDPAGRREVRVFPVGKGTFMTTTEFSLLQALQHIELLSIVTHSKESSDRQLTDKIIKTVVILNSVKRPHGEFFVSPPPVNEENNPEELPLGR